MLLRRLLLGSGSLAAIGGGVIIALSAGEASSQQLFAIERSVNANVVRYDVRVTKGGAYDTRRPLDVYWLLLAEDGRREELSPLERGTAYGYEILPDARPLDFGMRLVAAKERPLRVRRRGSTYRAEVVIGGGTAVLDSVYVALSSASVVPRVLYVELRGTSIAAGRPVRERIGQK